MKISVTQASVLFLALTFLGITGCANQQQDPNKTILISFDGFRHDYFQRASTPHFDTLAANGVAAEGLIPVFPSSTFPNHYTTVTGLYPENSGLVGNTMYDPKWDKWYRISDREAVENGQWYGGEPIWNTFEKQGLRTGTMFWVGSEADIQGMHPTHWKSYDESMPFKSRVDTVVKWLTAPKGKAVDFATLYFNEPDHVGHAYGPDSDSVRVQVERADEIMGYLKEKLQAQQLWENSNIVVLSDHGMVEVTADKIIRLDNIIDMDQVERTIWGALTMIQPVDGQTEQLYQSLKAEAEHYDVYKKADIPERYHLKNSRRVSDIVMIADLGYTILDEDYEDDFIESLPRGSHGYDNQQKAMQSIFMARGPAFHSGASVDAFQNVHIYELLNELMGTTPAPNDGSLDSVKVLLK
jgi:predicted AlkP superfamily pyrophosphatase or phosphodiesterase